MRLFRIFTMNGECTTPTKSFTRVDISQNSKGKFCIQCGEEITDSNKRRKLFNQGIKTVPCKSLERIVEREFNVESCLSNIICRNCVDKNTKLLHKLDLVRDIFHTVESTLIEKKGKLATKRQNSNDCDKQEDSASAEPGKYPAKRRVNFSTTESVTGSKNQETQTESIQVNSEVSSVTVSFQAYRYPKCCFNI